MQCHLVNLTSDSPPAEANNMIKLCHAMQLQALVSHTCTARKCQLQLAVMVTLAECIAAVQSCSRPAV